MVDTTSDIVPLKIRGKFEEYDEGEFLGNGTFGYVYKVTRKSDGKLFA